MANHKSALKRKRQTVVKNQRMSGFRSMLNSNIKSLKKMASEKKSGDELTGELNKTVSLLHKAASKGVVTKARASRQVSKLTKLVLNKK